MLKITVYAVGKLKEKFWKDACNEYLKRLSAYAPTTIIELPDSNKAEESALLLQKLGETPAHTKTILLDRVGKQVSSTDLADMLDADTLSGISHIRFIIGGSDGIDAQVSAYADVSISFGKITLPHNLARVVLLEQLYRACKISKGEPYHK